MLIKISNQKVVMNAQLYFAAFGKNFEQRMEGIDKKKRNTIYVFSFEHGTATTTTPPAITTSSPSWWHQQYSSIGSSSNKIYK